MTTLDKPASLAEALCMLQADPPAIVKAETANTNTYSYRYAGLAAVTAVVLPRLAALGCAWICRPTVVEGRPVLAYELRHVDSGETVSGEYPLSLPPGATPQVQGSMLSYARRYALLAVTGVAPEADDDDGAAASGTKPASRRSRSGTKDAEPASGADRPVPRTMITAIMASYTELGYGGKENADQRLTISANLLGLDALGSHNDLSAAQGSRLLDALGERKRAQRKETTDG